MKILVTGCSGFIGSHFCQKLLQSDYEVVGIDNFDPYYSLKLKEYNLNLLKENKNFQFVKGDFSEEEILEDIFSKNKIDKIVHIGAKAGVRNSLKYPKEYAHNNILGTINLLEIARKYDVDEFIFASSSSVYGQSDELPFLEEIYTSKPMNPYAASKKSCELFGYTYYFLYGINFLAFRFFTVYGPRGRPDMAIYKFVKNIYHGESLNLFGDGSFKRDFTYVSDIIDGIFLGLGKKLGFEIFNLGNEKPFSISVLIKKIEEILGKKANIIYKPVQKGDMEITYANINKAREILGFQPKIDIETGLRNYVEWYLEFKDIIGI